MKEIGWWRFPVGISFTLVSLIHTNENREEVQVGWSAGYHLAEVNWKIWEPLEPLLAMLWIIKANMQMQLCAWHCTNYKLMNYKLMRTSKCIHVSFLYKNTQKHVSLTCHTNRVTLQQQKRRQNSSVWRYWQTFLMQRPLPTSTSRKGKLWARTKYHHSTG